MSLVTDVFTTTIVQQVVEPTLSPLSGTDGPRTQINLIHTVTEVLTSSILVSPPTTSTSRAASTSTSFLSRSKSASATTTPSASSAAVAAAVPTTTAAVSSSASASDSASSADASSTALPSGIKAASQASASASAAASQGSGLPAGAIAGIVIGVVLLLNVIGVLIYRRRSLAKRRARRATWRAGVKALALPASLDLEKTAGVAVAPAHTSPFMIGMPGRQNSRHGRSRSDGSPESQYSLPSALTRSPDPAVSRDGVGRARSASPTRRPSGSRAAPERPPRAATRKSPPTVNQSLPPASAQQQPPRTALATPATAQIPTAVVRVTFIPTRADELSIAIGQTLAVLHAFDDGWALCQNAYGEQGMAPLECLEGGGGLFKGFGGHDARGMMNSKSKRRSSLAPAPQSGRYPRYP